jgi:hypothetical protein
MSYDKFVTVTFLENQYFSTLDLPFVICAHLANWMLDTSTKSIHILADWDMEIKTCIDFLFLKQGSKFIR